MIQITRRCLFNIVASFALAFAVTFFSGAAFAQVDDDGSSVNVQDSNKISPANLRKAYFSRYPYAKDMEQDDQVSNGSSQSGSQVNGSSPAYKQMERKCKDDKEINPAEGEDEHYHQPQEQVQVTPASARDKEAVSGKGMIKTYSYPCSDTQFQVIDRENRQRFLELAFDPERWNWTETMNSQMQTSSLSNGIADAAETSFGTAMNAIDTPLTNVANEVAGMPADGESKGIYIVQQIYQSVFIPMAVLMLLPGVILSQLKSRVAFSMNLTDEDSGNPFGALLRAVVAIFLIPATQLIVSYAIDTGNTLTAAVQSGNWIDASRLQQWAQAQTYAPKETNNAVIPPTGNASSGNATFDDSDRGADDGTAVGGGSSGGSTFAGLLANTSVGSFASSVYNTVAGLLGGGSSSSGGGGSDTAGQGKNLGQAESQVDQEDQLYLSSMMCIAFNSSSYVMGGALTILTGYQLVLVCYLMLLGPIAACFYAWPGGAGSLFRNVFSQWLNALVVLVLWKFYWCVILAIMTQRLIQYNPDPNSPWEMMIFNCFLALLLFVPFQPFNFSPGEVAAAILDKASQGLPQK